MRSAECTLASERTCRWTRLASNLVGLGPCGNLSVKLGDLTLQRAEQADEPKQV